MKRIQNTITFLALLFAIYSETYANILEANSQLNPYINSVNAETTLPKVDLIDSHGVNIMSAMPSLTFPIVSIGNDSFSIDLSTRHIDQGFVGPVLNHGGLILKTTVPKPGHEAGIEITDAIEVRLGFNKYFFSTLALILCSHSITHITESMSQDLTID